MNNQWKLVPVEPLLNMMSDKDHDTRIMAERELLAALAAPPLPPTGGQPEVVAVINEEGEHFKETVVEHRPGIDRLPVGTELVDRAHVNRLQAERDALQLRLNAADQRIDELTQQHQEDGQLLIEDHRRFIACEYEDLVDQASDFQDRAYALGVARGQLKAAAKMIGIERMPPMEYDEP
jgi:hypothetical protein